MTGWYKYEATSQKAALKLLHEGGKKKVGWQRAARLKKRQAPGCQTEIIQGGGSGPESSKKPQRDDPRK